MAFVSFWAIIILWLVRVFSIMFIRDLIYKDLYDGKWHYIDGSKERLGMNTPKGLLIRNITRDTRRGSAATITPPISNKMIKKNEDSIYEVTSRPFLDRLVNLLSFET